MAEALRGSHCCRTAHCRRARIVSKYSLAKEFRLRSGPTRRLDMGVEEHVDSDVSVCDERSYTDSEMDGRLLDEEDENGDGLLDVCISSGGGTSS